MKKRRFLGILTAFVMVFTMVFANAGMVFGASVGDMESAAQSVAFGTQYSASWTADSSDKEYYSKIAVPSAGVIGITATKPSDANGRMKLDLMLYNEDGAAVWGSEGTYTVDKDGDYSYSVGVLPGTYYLAMKAGSKVADGTAQTDFTVNFTENIYAEREPNTAKGDATQIDLGKTYTGFFGSDGAYKADECDVYKVDLIQGYTYKITVGNYAAVKGTSAMIDLTDAKGFDNNLNLKMDSAVNAAGVSTMTYKAEATGVHYIKLSNYNQAQFEYTVKVDQTSPAPVANLLRLCGADRFDTAMAAASHLKKIRQIDKFDNVIVAYGKNFPDALAGGYLAGIKEAPMLLVSTTAADENEVAEYIKNNLDKNGTVYILGGTKVVTARFANLMKDYKVKRLSGVDRYETNLKVLEAAGTQNKDLLVCTGKGYADSLSASATGRPILLVSDKGLTAEQKAYIQQLAPENIYVIGGVNAVKPAVANALKTYGNVVRVAGDDRYATSVAVAKTFFPADCSNIVYAYAKNYPDGLSGGPLAMSLGAPVILTDNAKPSQADSYSAGVGVDYGVVLGGTGLISDTTMKNILKY